MYYALLVCFFLPANAPEFEHVHFILHIEHCRLHTTCLYCILQMYHLTLQISKICLSLSQGLHGKMYFLFVHSKKLCPPDPWITLLCEFWVSGTWKPGRLQLCVRFVLSCWYDRTSCGRDKPVLRQLLWREGGQYTLYSGCSQRTDTAALSARTLSAGHWVPGHWVPGHWVPGHIRRDGAYWGAGIFLYSGLWTLQTAPGILHLIPLTSLPYAPFLFPPLIKCKAIRDLIFSSNWGGGVKCSDTGYIYNL